MEKEEEEDAAQVDNQENVPTNDGSRKPKPMKALLAKVNDLETLRTFKLSKAANFKGTV